MSFVTSLPGMANQQLSLTGVNTDVQRNVKYRKHIHNDIRVQAKGRVVYGRPVGWDERSEAKNNITVPEMAHYLKCTIDPKIYYIYRSE